MFPTIISHYCPEGHEEIFSFNIITLYFNIRQELKRLDFITPEAKRSSSMPQLKRLVGGLTATYI